MQVSNVFIYINVCGQYLKKELRITKLAQSHWANFVNFKFVMYMYLVGRYLISSIIQATLYLAEVGHWTVSEFERSPSTTSFYLELVCSCVHIEVKSLKIAFLSSTKVRSFFLQKLRSSISFLTKQPILSVGGV